MKNYIKSIALSFSLVLLLNIILFSILTVVQAPYYDEAPSEANSIYELYASEEYDEVVYKSASQHQLNENEIRKMDELFKSASIVKLNKMESYLTMVLLDKNDFTFLTMTKNYGDRKLAAQKLVASNVLVYSKKDTVYVVCCELTENEYDAEYGKIAIYKTKNKELAKSLTEYKAPKNKGFHLLVPEWRYDISRFPESYYGRQYVLSFFVEFVIAIYVIKRINQGTVRNH